MDIIGKLRDYIANDKIKEALDTFTSVTQADQNTVLLLLSRINRVEKQENNGTIDPASANIERNKIRYAVLSLITDLEVHLSEIPDGSIAPQDSQTFEKLFTESQLHRIDWLKKGLEKSACVCKIHNQGKVGTGFLVADRYVFTNNHVIAAAGQLQGTQVEFGYDDPTQPSTLYDLETDDFITSPPDQLDYSRVRLKIIADQKPIASWGMLAISKQNPQPDDRLTIIQHPMGRRKEIAFSEKGNSIWEHRLHYQISTEPGSSGSPVFDMDWNVIALHHAGGNLPVNAAGDRKYTNEGILFSAILQDIDSQS